MRTLTLLLIDVGSRFTKDLSLRPLSAFVNRLKLEYVYARLKVNHVNSTLESSLYQFWRCTHLSDKGVRRTINYTHTQLFLGHSTRIVCKTAISLSESEVNDHILCLPEAVTTINDKPFICAIPFFNQKNN